MADIKIHRDVHNGFDRYGITKTLRNGNTSRLFLSERDFRELLETGYELLIAEKEASDV